MGQVMILYRHNVIQLVFSIGGIQSFLIPHRKSPMEQREKPIRRILHIALNIIFQIKQI